MAKIMKEDVHKLLMLWCTDEMRFQVTAQSSFQNFQLPSCQDFKLICHKPLDEVWKYVIRYIKSVQMVKHVRGNIAVKNNSTGSSKKFSKSKIVEDESKYDLRRKLARDLTGCWTDISFLQNEMAQVNKEVMEQELAYQSVSQRVRDVQKKESFLQVVRRCGQEQILMYDRYTQFVLDRWRVLTEHRDCPNERFVTPGHHADVLESESQKDVRLTCAEIKTFLHGIFNRTLTSNQDCLKKAELELWRWVEKTASVHSIAELVSSLSTNAGRETRQIREETLGVNITKDALNLRFSYGSKSGLKDVSSPPTVEKSVKELLEASNLKHVLRWFKEQEYNNEEWKLSARLDDFMAEIGKQIHRVMGEHPRNVPLAKGYVDAVVELAIEGSVAPCLRAEADKLIEAIQRAKHEKQVLRRKFEQIQDFKATVGKNQQMISFLARQNSSAPDRMEAQKQQVLAYIRSKSIESHEAEVKSLTAGLTGSLISELEKFSPLVLSSLLVVTLDSKACLCALDLSLAPSINPLARDKLSAYSNVASAFSFPHFKSTDSLFHYLLEIERCIQEVRISQQKREKRVAAALAGAHTNDDINSFIDLTQKIEQHNRAQSQKFLPKLERRISAVSTQASDIESIKNQVDTWWEQPAQLSAPWVLTDGKTFAEWMQKWRLAVTQIHKKMMDIKSH
ncbi:HAUS augmin-like complex subunit 5 isoform X2 [Physella acuta]|uniref:HAUS augmin-like complex subunit 5 isoform X2 n=1 Tax=Physella acuta TaxID=109671 RepID=UPI0027DB5709|nr:HAUS augmin-like complex subunit 5 isoform X2 [Physella acuta]